jgi:hypothetical protein
MTLTTPSSMLMEKASAAPRRKSSTEIYLGVTIRTR